MASTTELNHDLERENEKLRSKRRQAEERVIELEAALKHSQSTVQKLTEENNALCTQKREKEVKELQGKVKSLTSRPENHVKTDKISGDVMFVYSQNPNYTKIDEVKTDSSSEQNRTVRVIKEKKNNDSNEKVSSDEMVSKILLGLISSKPVNPTYETVEKLLELATRVNKSSVIDQIENHLLNHSKIENEKMMWMGELYGMSDLLEKSIREMDTIEKVKKWKQSPEYAMFSWETQYRVFEKFF